MALGDEIADLRFESMIGGPLVAVIKAQAQAAQTSVDFIKSVGFEEDAKTPTMVTFSYEKMVPKLDGEGKPTGDQEAKPFHLTVPILTMLPIPFIRIEETTIDFNAKITSVEETATASSSELSSTLKAKGGWGPVSASLSVTYAAKKSSSSGSKVERTYSMAIHVRAVQEELPAGTERLLSILEKSITETAGPAPTPTGPTGAMRPRRR